MWPYDLGWGIHTSSAEANIVLGSKPSSSSLEEEEGGGGEGGGGRGGGGRGGEGGGGRGGGGRGGGGECEAIPLAARMKIKPFLLFLLGGFHTRLLPFLLLL